MCEKEKLSISWLEQTSQRLLKHGSKRKRIWELSRDAHCPVIGVCIPLSVLRKLVAKATSGEAIADDYEIHVGAISECTQRNRLSELIQADLDKRYASNIALFRSAKSPHALTTLWRKCISSGDVAGAFWAGLTHAQCDSLLQEAMLRDMHMLQHQAGACVRADLHHYNHVMEENAILSRELGKIQERSTRMMQEKTQEIEKLNEQLTQQRAENINKESALAFLREDMQKLKAASQHVETRQRLQDKVAHMRAHQQKLEEKIHSLRAQLTQAHEELTHKSATFRVAEQALSAAKTSTMNKTIPSFPITLYLDKKNVLCVGGRSSSVPTYRNLIEKVGGRFAHHDGGIEDNQSLLEASLIAADLVICQTACISHNAYWRVKEFCKRTGKRCVFVENPSASSLARSLEGVSQEVSPLLNHVDKTNV
jgi:hypothetical protein